MQNKMSIRFFKLLLWTITLTVILSGCMSVTQEIWIQPDGGGQCYYTIAISESLSKAVSKENVAKIVAQINQNNHDPSAVPLVTEEDKIGNHYYHYLLKTSDVHNCLINNFDKSISMKITSLPNGHFNFTQTVSLSSSSISTALQSLALDSKTLLEFKSAEKGFQDNYSITPTWNVILHIPGEKGFTNGDYDEKTNTVSWSSPLHDIIDYGKDQQNYFDLEYLPAGEQIHPTEFEQYLFIFGPGIGVGLILIIIFVVIHLQNKRRNE